MLAQQDDNVVPLRRGAKTYGRWEPWEGVRGGRIWIADDGRKTYYVRLSIKGARYQAKLNGTDPIALADQLRRFYADPAGFDFSGNEGGIRLDAKLVEAYLAWCAAPPPGRKRPRADRAWLMKKRRLTEWWAVQLKGRNLRKVELSRIREVLGTAKNYKQAVSVIKHLYTFLREEKGSRSLRIQPSAR